MNSIFIFFGFLAIHADGQNWPLCLIEQRVFQMFHPQHWLIFGSKRHLSLKGHILTRKRFS
ncbi:MAG: hypothetical protein H7837_10360 [Magnetococcus sp. MYC-9]